MCVCVCVLVQAHSLIAQVLRSSEDLGEPADYIPTFYQFSEAIEPCISAEVALNTRVCMCIVMC